MICVMCNVYLNVNCLQSPLLSQNSAGPFAEIISKLILGPYELYLDNGQQLATAQTRPGGSQLQSITENEDDCEQG